MHILVCIKQVPDTTEVTLSSDFTLQRDFIAQVMNPADESALELALKTREKHGGDVTVMSMGPVRAETTLREALSRGADRALLLTDSRFAGADTLVTAECLKKAAEYAGPFDLILCGRRAVDGETGQVGPMMASMMEMACIANATNAEWDGNEWQIDQLTENGIITWKAQSPALVTMCEWSHRLRLPTIMNLRRAHDAEVKRLTPDDLGIEECGLKASPTRVVHVSARPIGVRPCRKLTLNEVLDELEKREVFS